MHDTTSSIRNVNGPGLATHPRPSTCNTLFIHKPINLRKPCSLLPGKNKLCRSSKTANARLRAVYNILPTGLSYCLGRALQIVWNFFLEAVLVTWKFIHS